MKPEFMTWQEYVVFLLESIGIYNEEIMKHYYKKISKFMAWYRINEGIDIKDIPEEAELKLENRKKTISWRRIARALEKNDYYMKRLGFGQTKTEKELLLKLIHTYDNLLNSSTKTNDRSLKKIIEELEEE